MAKKENNGENRFSSKSTASKNAGTINVLTNNVLRCSVPFFTESKAGS